MNRRIVARAPGKLFLLGEYAVLDGCPAVVAAVGGHVEVSLEIVGPPGTVSIQAPPHAPATTFSPGEPLPLRGPLRFALAAVRATTPFRRPGIRIDIASRLSGPDGTTLGLGSSAAVTVAVVAVMTAAAGADPTLPMWRKSLLTLALGAHRDAQDGLGSGADVAASVYGGVIRFAPGNGSLPTVTPLTLPSDTILLAGWTGEPASTQGLVTHYRAAAVRAPAVQHAFEKSSRTCVDSFVRGLSDRSLPLDPVTANGDALESLGGQLDLPVMTAPLRRLVAVAREHGAGAKVSGAGGGDCGIALTRDRSVAERIRSAWRSIGITPLDLAIENQGVTLAYT